MDDQLKISTKNISNNVQPDRIEKVASLYDRYGEQVFNKCQIFVDDREKAEQLTHDIFLKAFVQMKGNKRKSISAAWIYEITYQLCLAELNIDKDKLQSLVFNEVEEKRIKVLHCNTEQQLLSLPLQQLSFVLQKLPPEDRILLLMYYQDELSIPEMQRRLNSSSEILNKQLNRAKERAIAIHQTVKNETGDEVSQNGSNPFYQLAKRYQPPSRLKQNLITSTRFSHLLMQLLDLFIGKPVATAEALFQTEQASEASALQPDKI